MHSERVSGLPLMHFCGLHFPQGKNNKSLSLFWNSCICIPSKTLQDNSIIHRHVYTNHRCKVAILGLQWSYCTCTDCTEKQLSQISGHVRDRSSSTMRRTQADKKKTSFLDNNASEEHHYRHTSFWKSKTEKLSYKQYQTSLKLSWCDTYQSQCIIDTTFISCLLIGD